MGLAAGCTLTTLGSDLQSLPAPANGSVRESEGLQSGGVLQRELAGGQKHSYPISLSQGQCARVVIEPRGLEVVARLLDPEGSVLLEAHSGPREARLDVVTADSVLYRVEVEPEYPRARPGKYTIRLEPPRPALEGDRLLFEASGLASDSRRLYREGDYEKARSAGERALEIREKVLGPSHAEVAATLNSLGLIGIARSDYARAEVLLGRALAIARKAPDGDLLAAEAADAMAKNSNARAQYAEAEGLAKQALAIRERVLGAEHFQVALSLGTLADIALSRSNLADAQSAADRALEIAGKAYGSDDLPYAAFLSRAGKVQGEQGNYARAEELCSRALDTAERIGGKESLPAADALQALASITLVKGDNVRSEELHERVLEIKERILGRENLDVGFILHNLGTLHYRRRNYAVAEGLFTRSLAIKEKALGSSHPLVAFTLNNLGLLYWRLGDYPKATDFFRRTLELCEKAYGPENSRVALTLGNLGIMAKETGDYERAEEYYRRALAILEKVHGTRNRTIVATVESLGILYRDRGDYAAAEPQFLRALQITEESVGPDHPDVARLLENLARLYSAKGDAANALKCLQRAISIQERNLPLNLAVGSERQKLAYFDPFARMLERIISFQVGQGAGDPGARDLAATTLMQRKGRVLDAMTDSLAALRGRSSAEDRALLDQLKDVTSRLAILVLNGPQKVSLAEHQKQIRALTEQREALEERVNRSSAGFYQRSDAVTLPAIQAALPADSALVEFAVYRPYDPKTAVESTRTWGDPRYVAYVIPGRGAVRWKDLGSAGEVDRAVEAFRQALRDPKKSGASDTARALDDRIMEPVRDLAGDARHLLLSPDGQLDLIPFEALVDEHGRYLVERYSVTYLSAGRDLLRLQVARKSHSEPLVIADPLFGEPGVVRIASALPSAKRTRADGRRSITTGADLSTVYFAPLSGTAEEAHAIKSLFPEARILAGAEATEAALKQVDAPRILHIATHGFFLQDSSNDSTQGAAAAGKGGARPVAANRIENPLLRSGLALTGANLDKGAGDNGILTALEAANLNLWGTRLVTLSACDTGVGEVKNGEGVYGLRRAFFLAGAESLVMSLWPVSDRVTREMMTAYYAGLKKGLGRGEALRQAQLAMLKRQGREHPFYWASFIQSGEWANLEGHR